MTELFKASDVLKRAAVLLDERGYWRGSYWDPKTGCVCPAEAIRIAAGLEDVIWKDELRIWDKDRSYTIRSETFDLHSEALSFATAAIGHKPTFLEGDDRALTHWNDAGWRRTKRQAKKMLRKAAELASKEEK